MDRAARHDGGYWPSRWPGEDGGPLRTETPRTGTGLDIQAGERLAVTTREAIVATMVVLRDPGEVYLLRHTGGPDAISWVERIEPTTLEVIARSPDLPGGKTWPGGVAAHANGALYVAFGRHVHRLTADLELVVTRELPRDRMVITYCRGPYCVYADQALALLQEQGWPGARLEEGVTEWVTAGRPLTAS